MQNLGDGSLPGRWEKQSAEEFTVIGWRAATMPSWEDEKATRDNWFMCMYLDYRFFIYCNIRIWCVYDYNIYIYRYNTYDLRHIMHWSMVDPLPQWTPVHWQRQGCTLLAGPVDIRWYPLITNGLTRTSRALGDMIIKAKKAFLSGAMTTCQSLQVENWYKLL